MKPIASNVEFAITGPYKSGLAMDLGGGQTLKLQHDSSSGVQGFEYATKTWSVGGNATKDCFFEFRHDLEVGKMKIRQNVPKGKFELAPSPVVTLNTKPKTVGKFRDEYELSYDFMTSTAKATEFLEYNGTHSVKIVADNKTGASGAVITLATKPKLPWAKMVGVTSTSKTGPVLVYAADPNSHVGLTGNYSIAKKELGISALLKATSDSRAKVKVDAKFGKAGLLKPAALGFGVTFDMK